MTELFSCLCSLLLITKHGTCDQCVQWKQPISVMLFNSTHQLCCLSEELQPRCDLRLPQDTLYMEKSIRDIEAESMSESGRLPSNRKPNIQPAHARPRDGYEERKICFGVQMK